MGVLYLVARSMYYYEEGVIFDQQVFALKRLVCNDRHCAYYYISPKTILTIGKSNHCKIVYFEINVSIFEEFKWESDNPI